MRSYFIALVSLTLVLVVAAFAVMWAAPQCFLPVMAAVPLYFAAVTAVQHRVVVKAAYGDARRFVKVFLGSVVVVMMLHLVALSVYMFTHLQQAKLFVAAFAVAYVAYLVFETVMLVAFVKKYKGGKE